MSLDPQVVERCREALRGILEDHRASAAIRDAFPDEPRPAAVTALGLAMDFDSIGPAEVERRSRWGPLGPLMEFETGVYPLPLDQIDEETLNHWSELAQAIDEPIAQARLNDLLWNRRSGAAPHQSAEAAIAGYIAISDAADPVSMVRTEAILRALELARETNNAVLQGDAVARAVSAVQTELAAEEPGPGVSISLLDGLSKVPALPDPQQIDALLEGALKKYEQDPWQVRAITDLMIIRVPGDADRQKQLQEIKVRAWEAAAARADSAMIRVAHLRNALDAARRYGHQEDADRLRAEIQAASADLELQTVSAKVDIPTESVEAFLATFVGTDLHESLLRFGHYCPLPEDSEQTIQEVQERMRSNPLPYLISRVLLGPKNLPVADVSTPEQHLAAAVHESEAMQISIWGSFAAEALERILAAHGHDRQAITMIFEEHPLTRTVADRLAEALDLYALGRYDAALMVCLPRLETIVREMCASIGIVTFVEPQGERFGRFKGLGDLIRELKGIFDAQRQRYLWNLLTNQLGVNLRNSGLHGLIIEGSQEEAALALHAACQFLLFQVTPRALDT